MKQLPPWQTPPIHPAAEKLPMMSDAEIDELATDIKANGLLEPIILWSDNHEEANGAEGPFDTYLLDGRNRLAALERLGISDPRKAPLGPKTTETVRLLRAVREYSGFGKGDAASGWKTEVDPTVYVLSANVRRRHLTSEQKRQVIAAYIEADPKASNRNVARTLGVSDHTVATVRSDQNAQIAHSDHLPIERAKAMLRDNPQITQRELKAAAKVGVGTVVKARKELEDAGEIQPKEKAVPKAHAKPKSKPKQTPASGDSKAKSDTVTNGGKLVLKRASKSLSTFSKEQLEMLAQVEEASSDDVAEYIAAVDQAASKLKAAAERIVASRKEASK